MEKNMLDELKQREKEISIKISTMESGDGSKPVVDGIINIEKYINAKRKILWILKECREEWNINKAGQRVRGGWNLVKDIYNRVDIREIKSNITTRRVLLVANTLLSNNPENALEDFRSIAFINIKKFPGGKFSVFDQIKKSYDNNKFLLLEQINTYNPEIIICGNVLQYFVNELDYNNGAKIPLGMGGHNYYCLKNKLYINAYHPSYKPRKNSKHERDYVIKIKNSVTNWETNFKGK